MTILNVTGHKRGHKESPVRYMVIFAPFSYALIAAFGGCALDTPAGVIFKEKGACHIIAVKFIGFTEKQYVTR